MSFFTSLDVSGSGLTAEQTRMDAISDNIANVNTTDTARSPIWNDNLRTSCPQQTCLSFPRFTNMALGRRVSARGVNWPRMS